MFLNDNSLFKGIVILLIISIWGSSDVFGQTEDDAFDLRFITNVDCSEERLTATVQIRAKSDSFKIGTSSVLFEYESSILEFSSYESLNFHPGNACVPGVSINAWDAHDFNSAFPGIFNLTLSLKIEEVSCPVIFSEWIDIGQIEFAIKDKKGNPHLRFDLLNSNFNRNIPNDGSQAPQKGTLFPSELLLDTICVCQEAILKPDTIKAICNKDILSINVLENDIVANPSISIKSLPQNGQASISPNGMLTYQSNNPFCGTDELIYRVCNEGDETCCQEAKVLIIPKENQAPVFTNFPDDLTLNCDQEVPLDIETALDECGPVTVNFAESIEEADCGDKTIIRIWTAIDECGKSTSRTQKVFIKDRIAPQINCASEISISCSDVTGSTVAQQIGVPSVTDNCSSKDEIQITFTDADLATSDNPNLQSRFVRLWRAEDKCGNSATCSQIINVIDDKVPRIDCPEDITLECGVDIQPVSIESQAVASDDCGNVSLSYEDNRVVLDNCNFDTYLIERIWTATDEAANQSTCIQKITITGTPCPEKDTPCNDNDLSTINDVEDGNCNCKGTAVPLPEKEITLRFQPGLDCSNNSYCVRLQAKSQAEDFFLGSSTIEMSYNVAALEFSTYTSLQFDETRKCLGGNLSPWNPHELAVNANEGSLSLQLLLKENGASCPELTTEFWQDIGLICFDIMDNDASPDLRFGKDSSQFKCSAIIPGVNIEKGVFHDIIRSDALNCTTDSQETGTTINVAIKAILQGPYQPRKGLMADSLRKKGYIPLKEPYTGLPAFNHVGAGGGEEVSPSILDRTGPDAIIDWVFLELRSALDSTVVIETRAALIQSDGDIVDLDGQSNVRFPVEPANYYLVLRHRNHLGIMTKTALPFKEKATAVIDFSDPNTATFGEYAQLLLNGRTVLWGGNADPDKYLVLRGGGLGLPDGVRIFFDVFLAYGQANPGKPLSYNNVLHGYYGSDVNLDGRVKYQGPKNDIDANLFFNIIFHPKNTTYKLNFFITEQVP
jgi:hypothetical protein